MLEIFFNSDFPYHRKERDIVSLPRRFRSAFSTCAVPGDVTRVIAWTLFFLGAAAGAAAAVGDARYVEFADSKGGLPLVTAGRATPLLVDINDHAGVIRVVNDLRGDVRRVTGVAPDVLPNDKSRHPTAVIVGTIGKSTLIDELVRSGKLDVRDTVGKWEAYVSEVIDAPLPGIDRALVIAGSDKRGTIYGVYALSEQIGVSPWYWWADVPTTHREALFIKAGSAVKDAPVVKYRGIFLNDEAPSLTNWAKEKFGGFNHEFYTHVFELILRLRGNYLWPAMWGSAFNDDDPLNPRLADEYGIVMGTSHHEPLMRAHDEWRRHGKGPWDYAKNDAVLREFWRGGMERTKNFEQIVTIGMRGDGDEAMSEETNVALLERIVSDQRKILTDVTGKPAAQIPQLWALYKEVQGYYERGMRVPDDVTLLWCDDNWGNIRRLPTPAERGRSGGAGVYYHFDYVGGPRNYKWLNTVPLTKIWEQMNLAWKYDATRIWIVNVGDLKPMEFPIEFFLNFGWNPGRWPYEKLETYSEAWAARDFGTEHAAEIAALINGYTKLNGRRKPEMIAPETLSLENYREAERVLAEWRGLVERAEAVSARLPKDAQSAFFQLVLYPVKASANVQELYVAAGQNQLFAQQGRSATNAAAARVHSLFALDGKLVAEYHAINGGKWNHMMDQVKFGYTYWQQPPAETMPAVSEVRPLETPSLALALEGSTRSWPSYNGGPAVLPSLDALSGETRWIEIFNRGRVPFSYRVTADQPWVTISADSGTVEEITRIEIGARWADVPLGESSANLRIAGAGESVSVRVPLIKRSRDGLRGFVETDRVVAIEAPNFARAINSRNSEWRVLPGFGRTLGGVTSFPVTAPDQQPGGDSPRLEYDVTLFTTGEVRVELQCAPSLDFQSGEGLRLAVSLDDSPPQILKLDTWSNLQTWEKAVGDGVRRVSAKVRVETAGAHVLKVWRVTPGVVLERLILDAGGLRPSYLGPPESPRMAQ